MLLALPVSLGRYGALKLLKNVEWFVVSIFSKTLMRHIPIGIPAMVMIQITRVRTF